MSEKIEPFIVLDKKSNLSFVVYDSGEYFFFEIKSKFVNTVLKIENKKGTIEDLAKKGCNIAQRFIEIIEKEFELIGED